MADFIKSDWEVTPIDPFLTKDWILNKHYAHRLPSISYAFGLFRIGGGRNLSAIITFGHPMAPVLISQAFSGEYTNEFYELNRLCADEGLPRNALSYLVGQALKMMPKPCVIVSYADSSMNHHGYIYQATNWIYTGLSAEFKDYMIKGLEHQHNASILDKVGRSDKSGHIDKVKLLKEMYGEENIYMRERPRKHRYFYLLGSKSDIRHMRSVMKYKPLPYPKGDNIRYDASYKVAKQQFLF